MADDELKPYPFCGSEATLEGEIATFITCDNLDCHVTVQTYGNPSRKEAIAAWNHRTAQQSAPFDVEATKPVTSLESREQAVERSIEGGE